MGPFVGPLILGLLDTVQESQVVCEVPLNSNVSYIIIKFLQLPDDIKIYVAVKAPVEVWPGVESHAHLS